MKWFFDLSFLFIVGAVGGYIMELFFRRFVSAKKWINPGFLTGPVLPIYGFGIVGMYVISTFLVKLPIESVVLKDIIIVLIIGVLMTLIELITGEIFIIGMNIKLWDYSDRWGNFKGIICPLFSLIWTGIGALYFFFVHKGFVKMVEGFNQFSYSLYFLGLAFGILFVDVIYSFNVSSKISKIAKDLQIVVKYEHLKESISNQVRRVKEKSNFLFPFKSKISLKDSIKNYFEEQKLKKENKNKKA